MTGYIYKIVNVVDGMIYIGQTIGTVEKRCKLHQAPKSGCTYFKGAIQKYGVHNFLVIVMETIESDDKNSLMDKLNSLEENYIIKFNSLSPNGYNLRLGGRNAYKGKAKTSRAGWKHTDEAKAKIVEAKTGMKYGPKTPEQNKRSADAHKKAIKSNETGQEWPSILECAESFNVKPEAIHRVLRGVRKSFRNMTFSYVNSKHVKDGSYIPLTIPLNPKKPYGIASDVKRAIKCNETDQTWESISAAARFFNVNPEAINRVLRGVRKSFRNMTFSYILPNLIS